LSLNITFAASFQANKSTSMHFYQSPYTDPYFNIATEEYLLKHFDFDFFYLYRNEPSIIVGKHQNTLAEINVPYVMENNLKVVRRLSGGGTVFHDLGNLNYCFIQKGAQGQLVDFKKYAQPILNTLQILGVKAYLKGKSDLAIDELKFSGNAEHVYRNKVLHHGTLLFKSELNQLNEAIKNDWARFTDKAVRSNRSKVTNISDHLSEPIDLLSFTNKIKDTVFAQQPKITEFHLSESDHEAIKKLRVEKYETWQWNFAYSPPYQFKKTAQFDKHILEIDFRVEKGTIKNPSITWNNKSINEFEKKLQGIPHEYQYLKSILARINKDNIPLLTTDMLLKNLF
jgi:lipoate-protein ligase A